MTRPLIWREIYSAPTDGELLFQFEDGSVCKGRFVVGAGWVDRFGSPIRCPTYWAYPPKRSNVLPFIICVLVLAAVLSQCEGAERAPGALTGWVVPK